MIKNGMMVKVNFKGAHRHYIPAMVIRIDKSWATIKPLSLGQVACADKSNEITAIPELLKLVDCDSSGLSDTGGSQIMIPHGDLQDEPDQVRDAVTATAVYAGV